MILKIHSILRKGFIFLLIQMLVSCSHHELMNHTSFQMISTGSNIQQVFEEFGPPYDVVRLKDGNHQYRYIQRIPIAKDRTEQVHYIITVSEDGLIIHKYSKAISSHAEFSYE